MVKNSPTNAGDAGTTGSILGQKDPLDNCHKNMDVSLTHYLLGNRAACEQCPGGAHRQWL